MRTKQEPAQENGVIDLICGKDPVKLGIRTSEGWNITAFLDHLNLCQMCCQKQAILIGELNKLIGGYTKMFD